LDLDGESVPSGARGENKVELNLLEVADSFFRVLLLLRFGLEDEERLFLSTFAV
jgi:hypothetical protein